MNRFQCPIRSHTLFNCLVLYYMCASIHFCYYFCTCALALSFFFFLSFSLSLSLSLSLSHFFLLFLLLTFSFSLFAESTLLSLHSLDRSHLRHQQSKSISTSGPTLSHSHSLTHPHTQAHIHTQAIVFYWCKWVRKLKKEPSHNNKFDWQTNWDWVRKSS